MNLAQTPTAAYGVLCAASCRRAAFRVTSNAVLARRSRSEPGIQIADLLAGAILRRDAKREAEAYGEQIEKKLKRVLEFRG